MTTSQNSDERETQDSADGTTTSEDQGGETKPDSTNGTGVAPDDEHADDPVTGVGPEDPS